MCDGEHISIFVPVHGGAQPGENVSTMYNIPALAFKLTDSFHSNFHYGNWRALHHQLFADCIT